LGKGKEETTGGRCVHLCYPRKKGIVGRERLYDRPSIIKELEAMPREERTAIRSMAGRLEVAPSTLHAMIRNEKVLKPHGSAVAPLLSEQDKMVRMLYAASRIDTPTYGNKLVYKASYDEIHVDEKWFYITPLKERVYLSQRELEEDLPQRKVKHKSHVLKVMFFAAVARPRYKDGECVFDGKIGF
jgi:hypothetical protein